MTPIQPPAEGPRFPLGSGPFVQARRPPLVGNGGSWRSGGPSGLTAMNRGAQAVFSLSHRFPGHRSLRGASFGYQAFPLSAARVEGCPGDEAIPLSEPPPSRSQDVPCPGCVRWRRMVLARSRFQVRGARPAPKGRQERRASGAIRGFPRTCVPDASFFFENPYPLGSISMPLGISQSLGVDSL